MAKIIGNVTSVSNPNPDWNQQDSTKSNYILNKPTFLSQFENDTNFLTEDDMDKLVTKEEIDDLIKDMDGLVTTDEMQNKIDGLFERLVEQGTIEVGIVSVDNVIGLSDRLDQKADSSIYETKKITGQTSVNNCDYSVAFGDASYSGYMCPRIVAYDPIAHIITLDALTDDAKQILTPTSKEKLKGITAYTINIDGGDNYPYCAKILMNDDGTPAVDVNSNTIQVSGDIETNTGIKLSQQMAEKPDEVFLLYVDGKPNLGNNALGSGQVAMGLKSHAISKGSTTFGRENYASGGYSFAAGRQNNVAQYGVAFGKENKVFASYAAAIGLGNEASGMYSFATGHGTVASGGCSFAGGRLGNNNIKVQATGDSSFAFGWSTKAYGGASTAFGNSSIAYNTGSVAMGFGAKAGSGDETDLSEGCVALGYGVTAANRSGQTVVGIYNDTKDIKEAIFVVGNGTSEERSNAFMVMYDGSATLRTMNLEKDNSVVIKSYVDSKISEMNAASKDYVDGAFATKTELDDHRQTAMNLFAPIELLDSYITKTDASNTYANKSIVGDIDDALYYIIWGVKKS